LLDGLFAAERREPLLGLRAMSRASTYPPGASVPASDRSFGAGRIDLFLSVKTRIGRSPAITMEGTGACAAFILFQPLTYCRRERPACTAPAVVLTVLAVARFADDTCRIAVAMRSPQEGGRYNPTSRECSHPHAIACRIAKCNRHIGIDLVFIALTWSLLRFGSQESAGAAPVLQHAFCALPGLL
jgi:hypothetical protein